MSKHTPGPWRWRREDITGDYYLSPGILLTSYSDGTPWGDELDRANAALIEAAPVLLEALKGMVHWHAVRSAENDQPLSPELQDEEVRAAMSAIAKAEGRS